MARNPNRLAPSEREHPNPTTKIGPKMGVAPTKMESSDPKTVLTTTATKFPLKGDRRGGAKWRRLAAGPSLDQKSGAGEEKLPFAEVCFFPLFFPLVCSKRNL